MLCCFEDGTIRDPATHLPVPPGALAGDLCGGRRFTAYERATGADCTYRVLAQVLAAWAGLGMCPAQHVLTGRSGWSRQ
ncbi:hypothetical protein CG747_43265 [Streptomyces sp. CB02959]|nr:hypothetical protein CG747_43265 [Streptomyces sp. CB02959]